MVSIGRVVAVMLTGVSVPMELESGVQYLELWYGIWRTAPGAARCSFVPCCGSFVRARALRSLFQFVPFGARARTHTLLGFTFPGGPVSVISRGRRTLFPRSSPPPRILDDRIYDKRHCCCRARARCAHPAVPGLSPSQSSANACYVICCRMSLPTHATPSSARSPRTHPFALSSQPY